MMRIQIRLIGNRFQLTKFQLFQRAILAFNGTAMILLLINIQNVGSQTFCLQNDDDQITYDRP